MRQPLPKPEKRGPKEPQPLQRKTPLRSGKKDPSDTRKVQWWHRDDPMWSLTRRLWFEQNPPPFGEYYQCGLCPYMVHISVTTLDHIETRSSRPDLKYILSNLQPAHALCNFRRGSMALDAYWELYPIGEYAFPQL